MNSDQKVLEELPDASAERSDAVRSIGTFEPRRLADLVEPNGDIAIPSIKFRNVNFSYEDRKVVDDLSFQLAKGEIKIILSGSGGGKSTILKHVLGLLKPDAGQIFIDGEEISELDESELHRTRDKIGMVFQEGALFDSLTVYENVAYCLQEKAIGFSVHIY
jgi:ABC-type transporter Mla maintaining outer membrane lipid asymmetry ATPase subunit MlaF